MVFGKNNRNRRIVISGTYGVGKTSTTERLSELTGIPSTKAKQMRQILPETFPGKLLEECEANEVYQLILTRFADRKAKEEQCRTGFVSDGSALHEWAYGQARLVHGAGGHGTQITDPGYAFAITEFGNVAKRHAQAGYDEVIHLPIEFPLPHDGHRPVSEDFRNYADQLIRKTWEELGKPVHIVGGETIDERVSKIVNILGLEVSSTLNIPQNRGNIIWWEKLEDVLGDPSQRYFTNGFRNTQHYIYDVDINPTDRVITAKADVMYNNKWSLKSGNGCKKHLSSNDALLIIGQLAQALMYAEDGMTRSESNNMWLRCVQLKTVKAIEDLGGIPIVLNEVETTMPEIDGKIWHVASMKGNIGGGAFRLCTYNVCYELPKHLQNQYQLQTTTSQ